MLEKHTMDMPAASKLLPGFSNATMYLNGRQGWEQAGNGKHVCDISVMSLVCAKIATQYGSGGGGQSLSQAAIEDRTALDKLMP